jgi:hypothetical protein
MRSGLQTNLRYLSLVLLLLLFVSYAALPAVAATASEGVPSVVIQKRRVVIVRTGKVIRDFQRKKGLLLIIPQ